MAAYDLVIRSGLIADGTGGPLRAGDVAVKDGRVAAVGEVDGTGAREINAESLLVAPGWVDIHTHYDGQATWDPHLTPSSWLGATTVVFGNCGVGFAPARPADRRRLVELMEGVEDIPGTALHEGLPWDWESFPEYLDALERRAHDIDFAAQLPHGALRVYVMGDRGANREPATPEDIAEMATLAGQAMEAGALGFTTSRTLNHRTSRGEPTPTLTAAGDELAGIAAGLAAVGKGVLQLVSDFTDLDAEWAILRHMAEESGRPLSISVIPESRDLRMNGDGVLKRIAAANASGLRVTAQVGARSVGLLMGFNCTLHPFMTNPVFEEIADRPLDEQIKALRQRDYRRRLLDAHTGRGARKLGGSFISLFDRMFLLGDPPNYEPDMNTCVTARAAATGRPPEEVALDALLADDGHAFLYLPLTYDEGNLDAVRGMLTHPNAVPGLSDGGAHVGTICDASFPTFLLAHWGRDRNRGRFPIEWIVERQTRATARTVGLGDRGVLAPGYKADINVIDLAGLRLRPPEMHRDLPAGGRRLLQRAEGYRHTFVSGVEIACDGEPTGALPGRLVRGAQAAPTQA